MLMLLTIQCLGGFLRVRILNKENISTCGTLCLNDLFLFKCCSDQVFRKCILDHKVRSVLASVMTKYVGGI